MSTEDFAALALRQVGKLWISAEIDADVDAKHEVARKRIEPAVNRRLASQTFTGDWMTWAIISMIMSDDDAYHEVFKKSARSKGLEFRLKIDRAKFAEASQADADRMLLAALSRFVDRMSAMKLTEQDVALLRTAFADVAKQT